MAYDRSYWKDHVTDQSGEVIQQAPCLTSSILTIWNWAFPT